MSRTRQLVKAITKLIKQIGKQSLSAIKKQIIWLLRTIFGTRKRRSSANAGFVLPTVAMVSLVVVLLTTAILIRSFDRSKNASNVRVNEAVLNAAMPAIDRAKAKLEQLLNDPSLPRSTPTDIALYNVIKDSTRYKFGDETRLTLATEVNGTSGIQVYPTDVTALEDDETLNTAWKFPVDTDNNGKFDSFTLYAIYFRSPTRNTDNVFDRSRKTLDARTPPMDKSQVGGICADSIGTSASLVGDSSWYKSGGNLAKSFFVYTVNVPIDAVGGNTGLDDTKFEAKANRGFSALEYQQDRERIPVNNKAVWFENDLEITPGSQVLLNGSIHTNGSFLAGAISDQIHFRQVSSQNSCFYDQENAKVTIGGNLAAGGAADTANRTGTLRMDLFRGIKVAPWLADQTNPAAKIIIGGTTGETSTTAIGGSTVGSNDAAYTQRISKMKEEALGLCTTCATVTTVADLKDAVAGVTRYPKAVKDNFLSRVTLSNPVLDTARGILDEEIESFLRDRTRRVPFAIVSQAIPTPAQALGSYETGTIFTGTGEIEVPEEWRLIDTANTGLTLNLAKLQATEPEKQKTDGKENYAGDRVLIGNNLPAYWKNAESSAGIYGSGQKFRQTVSNSTYWDSSTTPNEVRTRASQIQPQLSLGQTDRDEFWEEKAVEDNSANPLANVGGLRVVTGAGIYVDDDGVTRAGETPVYQRQNPTVGQEAFTSFLPYPKDAFPLNTSTDPGVAGLDLNIAAPATGFISTTTTGRYPDSTVTGQMPAPPTFDAPSTAVTNIVVWPDTMPMSSPLSTETRKGDLLMRATAVYHFKDDASNLGKDQAPIACVSSYYDPTTNITAQNLTALTTNWTNPAADTATVIGRSNNGISYAPPYTTAAGRTISSANLAILTRQSRLVFPNGRIANEPLRKAIKEYNSNGFNNFTMENYSAIDTALCALSILNGTATIDQTKVPHGAIREASFLDAREIKANQDRAGYQTGTQGSYTLDLEQRQPLEIRTTDINLGVLASQAIGTGEYLLPKSGIIYATRDDALPDVSDATVNPGDYPGNAVFPGNIDKTLLLSQTDFKLDPTRRPNGIRLINGGNLARGGTNSATYDPSEKGLILVSNLSAYIKGTFNLHQVTTGGAQIEEFTQLVNTSDASFYGDRTSFNNDFACRPGRGGCPTTGGDLWRPSTILADAITLLSDNFQDGFRNHGDYDFRDNATTIPDNNNTASPNLVTAKLVNNFVTSADWADSTGYPKSSFKTSYLANGVTPIQRRATFNEYLMEVCDQPSPSMCDQNNPSHWKVFFKRTPTGTPESLLATQVYEDNTLNSGDFVGTKLLSGTTATPPDAAYRNYPHRVAFERVTPERTAGSGNPHNHATNLGELLFRNGGGNEVAGPPNNADNPVLLGIDGSGGNNGNVIRSPYRGSSIPRTRPNALWFKTTSRPQDPSQLSDGSYNVNQELFLQSQPRKGDTTQPQLVPVLQIFTPQEDPSNNIGNGDRGNSRIQEQWVQIASTSTTYNTGLAAGNSPSRPDEQAAGLQVFVRYLENWTSQAKIRGNFIQFKRSSFATASLATILTGKANTAPSATPTDANLSFFDYPYNMYWTNNGPSGATYNGVSTLGVLPYYSPPRRDWGFDVALLTQLPDLFAQRFTVPPSAPPSEFFREVGRDDKWVETLLCATEDSDFALPESYRPSDCQLAPS